MGKKKQQKESKTAKQSEDKGKKTYSLQSVKTENGSAILSELPKVAIPSTLEKDLLELIQSSNLQRTLDKEVSKRLTQKKLMDIYTSLSGAGFAHRQIEQSMENTILHGGDLIDALDWLCLNLQNDKLPANFSQTLQSEEEKKRPRFDVELQVEPLQAAAAPHVKAKDSKAEKPQEVKESQKDWILQYAEGGSEEEGLSDEDIQPDTNERYIELTALLLDAKEEASEEKKAGNKSKLKEISKRIREMVVEMGSLEKLPDFNSELKLKDSDEVQGDSATVAQSYSGSRSHDTAEVQSEEATQGKNIDQSEEGEDLGLSLFQNAEQEPVPKEKVVEIVSSVRNFEYTRQQWTGKSPKQFLIDWCRKHLQKSPPPKFQKISLRGSSFKCRVSVERQKDGRLELCPDILCGNVKEAEHLAATLALYHLCKGQSVYQLLPPPYRDVWLEWLDAEKKAAQDEKSKENKPRDQFLAKLMSKIQLSGPKSESCEVKGKSDDGVIDSWEDMELQEEQAVSHVPPDSSRSSAGRKLQSTTHLKDLYLNNQSSTRYIDLLKTREQLPVYQHKSSIIEILQQHNVVLIAGETGSGKSTQIPHFVLQDCLRNGSEKCNIVCTEPRRISAISLATRVSQEMGEPELGSRESLCGYQIRFESKYGANTCLTYCTTGVLLRKLQLDSKLQQITHVIVDEVHERSVQSDFLLIILGQLLKQRSDLKVILMSATLDADKFSAYFNHCPIINIPGRTFPVQVFHVEDAVEMTGYVLDEDSPYSLKQSQLVQEESATINITEKGGNQSQVDVFWTVDDISTIDQTNLSADKYSLKTRNTITRMNMKRINMDLIVDILVYLNKSDHYSHLDGAVLIFLPGLADITELYETLNSDRKFADHKRYRIIALHSVLSSSDQAQAFTIPPAGVRKIVLATNIAETGITIPDVVFVIDAGKVKENRYIETSQMNALEEVFISKASAKQRQGRAGRVRDGICFRLFTKQTYDSMKPFTIPELLRVPLEELCLHIMKCDYGKPEEFLSQALDPPQSQVVSRAMSLLYMIGACVEGEKLTPLGHHLAALPVHVRIGKMLLYAAVFGCLEPVAVIAASMTDKSPFVVPLGKLDAVNAAKQSIALAASDHLTIYKAYHGWRHARSHSRHAEVSYCQKNFLKRNTMLEIENVKSDLMKLIHSIGFSLPLKDPSMDTDYGIDGVLHITKHKTHSDLDPKTIAKVKAVLTAGLYPNIAKVTYAAPVDAAVNPDQRICVTETQQGPAHVHPSSVNRNLQANGWLVFHEKVKSSKIYLRDTTLVSAFPLLLFGGEINVQHTEQLLTVDDRIKYKAYAKTGVIFKELRKLLDDLLARKLEDPSLDTESDNLIKLIEELLVSERSR
ncbi:ATP-dependent RNA helicase dhx29-like [Mercenaria mercenaria]|uniref:ATP-dependent RNA helicase dhx29-like n=1 Tax=Mercenaria mercenaria TaxID=6596 RepID=UPI00234FAC43|nr:ATP-dependent RNA helicase dhx29-like [Mercenaria mercenaria]XP_053396908.1 ATP-dependent RNA helicase dhx29-like [Mercenaria mercenaria]